MTSKAKTEAIFGLSGLDYPLGLVLNAVGAVLIFEVIIGLIMPKPASKS